MKQILHSKNRFLFILVLLVGFVAPCWAQNTITGEVYDTEGQPIPAVTVRLVGTKMGTTTDLQGNFSIKAEKGQKLRFSFIGLQAKTVRITKKHIKVVLEEDAQQLEQVVVTGYQNIQTRNYTGATNMVKAKDIHLEGISDISRMLEGRVPGLSIQSVSATFGAAPRINIRGGASILGNVQPLWVIDGAVYDELISLTIDQLASGDATTLISSAVAGLNAADIEDIQILKDASATSVYGARALNGVIVVTTKSAKKNSKLQVHYNSEFSMRSIPSYNEFNLLNSQETMAIYQEMYDKGYFGLKESLYGRRGGVYYQLAKGITTYNSATGEYEIANTPEARATFLREREYANTDWFKHLFTLRPTMEHNVGLSVGGEHSATRASLGYFEDFGWSVTDRVNRFTANIKSSFAVGERFQATLSLMGSMRKQKAPGTMPEHRNTAIGNFVRDFDINPFAYALGTSRTLRPFSPQGEREFYRNNWAPFNIIQEYENNYLNLSVLDFKAQAEVSYKIMNALLLKGMLAVRGANSTSLHEIAEASNMIQAFRANKNPYEAADNIYLWHDPLNPALGGEVALPNGGILHSAQANLRSYLGRIAADFDKTWGGHRLKTFAFIECRQADRLSNQYTGYGIEYNKGNQVFTHPIIFEKLFNQGEDYFTLRTRSDRGVTFSQNITYTFNNRYVANLVFNIEGSNAHGKTNRSRWLPTWNVGGKWNIDKEKFFEKLLPISQLDLRASYGLTAKMNEQALNASVIYQNSISPRPSLKDRENGIIIQHLENRDLTWEKMYEFNIGVDLGIWNNRFSASIDVYQRNAFDLIDLVRTSAIGGEYFKYANFGDMKTQGCELTLRGTPIQLPDFSWTSTLTFSLMQQRITRLINTPNAFDLVAGRGRGNLEGYPKGALYSFNFQGLNNQGLPTFNFGLYPIGDRMWNNVMGADFLDSQFAKSYLIYHGPVEPPFIGGFSNNLRYKNWELGLFITAQVGNKIRLNPTYDALFQDLNVFSRDYANRWLSPGDEWITDVPVIPSVELINQLGAEGIERAYNTYNYSQVRVVDGSFVRLKNISLAYQFPQQLCQKMRIASLRMQMNVTNPFLIYSDKRLYGQDPEYYKSGGVSQPTPRQYTLSFSLAF